MAYTNIDDPSAYFQIATYTGNANFNTITNDGNSVLAPDFVWGKCTTTSKSHFLYDTTRGTEKRLESDNGSVEDTGTNGLYIFQSDGFKLASGNTENDNGETYVAWQWKANGGTRTTFSESGNNPAGGYQANTTAGFSIVDYTGTQATCTVAHGLGAVPKMIIVKDRDASRSWSVYHHQMGSPAVEKNMHLNTTAAVTDYNAEYWGGTNPTTSVFSLGNAHDINYNNRKYIAYVFAEVQGYSKFGSYVGNGASDASPNTDGPFIYTGFSPAFVIIKKTSAVDDWLIFDNKRAGYDPAVYRLYPNSNTTETSGTNNTIQFTSNGFKIRFHGGSMNTSGGTYIYMAFAEQPFVTSTGTPTTAR